MLRQHSFEFLLPPSFQNGENVILATLNELQIRLVLGGLAFGNESVGRRGTGQRDDGKVLKAVLLDVSVKPCQPAGWIREDCIHHQSDIQEFN